MSETARSHEVWSFVQMLPLFLLSLPLLAAWELYVGISQSCLARDDVLICCFRRKREFAIGAAHSGY